MLRDSCFKKSSMRKRKTAQPPRCLPFGRGISSPHGNGVTGKARHLAVNAVHEKGNQEKVAPSNIKKASKRMPPSWGRLPLKCCAFQRAILPNSVFAESTPRCDVPDMRSASRPFKIGKANTCRLQSRRRRPCFARSTV